MKRFAPPLLSVCLALACLISAVLPVYAVSEASDFLAAVNAVEEYDRYEDRAAMIAAAEARYDAAFATAEGVAQAKSRLDAYRADVDAVRLAAEGYIAAVDRAASAWATENYTATAAALREAEGLYLTASRYAEYPGLASKHSDHTALREILRPAEEASADYVELAEEMRTLTSYRDKRNCYTAMKRLEGEILSVYPGITEARAIFLAEEEYLLQCESEAGLFIERVKNASSAESYPQELALLVGMRDTVDGTVEGVRDAKENLAYLLREYNTLVRAANAEMKNASLLAGDLTTAP